MFALLLFSALIVHDGREVREGGHFGFGRRMDTSVNNPVIPSSTVTPDLVAQKAEDFGIVAEIKRSLSSDPTTWTQHIDQIRKYDDRLKGWWTNTELLRKYPHSMHSVQHGNPYVHVQISDVYDGSAFDVWAVSNQSIVLVPRLKATEAAFQRLIHYVFDRFREGEVREYSDS